MSSSFVCCVGLVVPIHMMNSTHSCQSLLLIPSIFMHPFPPPKKTNPPTSPSNHKPQKQVISALPVVELRGGVPVGLWMGIPPLQTFALACVGNFLPVPFILLALNNIPWLMNKVGGWGKWLTHPPTHPTLLVHSYMSRLPTYSPTHLSLLQNKKVTPVLEKKLKDATGSKMNWQVRVSHPTSFIHLFRPSTHLLQHTKQALAVFVGVPLPGTGAWTGAAIGALFKLTYAESILGVVAGIVSAGAIMTALVLSGLKGALCVGAGLLVSLLVREWGKRAGKK